MGVARDFFAAGAKPSREARSAAERREAPRPLPALADVDVAEHGIVLGRLAQLLRRPFVAFFRALVARMMKIVGGAAPRFRLLELDSSDGGCC
jgi:hypothetical protein